MTWTPEEQAILDARTESVAQAQSSPSHISKIQAVCVVVAGESYALAGDGVMAVAAMSKLTHLPWSPPAVAGLLGFAGAAVPAFHLRALLDLPLVALPEYGRAILLGKSEVEVALVVEQVTGTASLDLADLSPPPESLTSRARDFVHGVDDDGMVVLDAPRLLASDLLYVDIDIPEPEAPHS